MKSKRTLDFMATMRQHGVKEEVAREILSIMDEREGELATKIDIERLEASIDQLRTASRQDIERLEASIDQLKEGQKEQREQSRKEIEQAEKRLEASIDQVEKRLEAGIRGNRWAITIAISTIGLVFTAIITGSIFFWGQISDMRADIRELLQIHLNEQQAERTASRTNRQFSQAGRQD